MIKICIQIEAGSQDRYLYDEKTLVYKGTRRMPLPFPYAYGFIPGTSAADGDCVDCYLITKASLKPGSLIDCEPVGLLEQDEAGEIDHKILAALPGQDVEIDEAILQELRDFIYAIFAQFPGAPVRLGRFLPREAALDYIETHRAVT